MHGHNFNRRNTLGNQKDADLSYQVPPSSPARVKDWFSTDKANSLSKNPEFLKNPKNLRENTKIPTIEKKSLETLENAGEIPRKILPEKLKRETFEDFAARVLTSKTSELEIDLGPEIHAALLSLANGIDPIPVQKEEKKRQAQREMLDDLRTRVEHDPGDSILDTNPENYADSESKAFTSTFGVGIARSSIQDMENFQKRNNLWKSNVKATVKYLQEANKESAFGYAVPNSLRGSRNMTATTARWDGWISRITKKNETAAVKKILSRGALLLKASEALQSIQSTNDEEELKPTEYISPSKSFMANASIELPIVEKLETRREAALNNGFPFDTMEEDMNKEIRQLWKATKKSIRKKNDHFDSSRPFGGLELSPLVPTDEALERIRNQDLTPEQLKILQKLQRVQGSDDYDRKSYQGPPKLRTFKPKKVEKPKLPSPSKLQKMLKDQKLILSEIDRDLRDGKKRHETGYKLWPSNKDKLKLAGNRDILFNSVPENTEITEHVPPPASDKLESVSFQNVTRSEFIRLMKKHEQELPKIASKNETKGAFPQSYLLQSIKKSTK